MIGAIVALISLAGAGFATAAARDAGAQNAGIFAAVFGVGAVIFLPIFYGLIGLVSGALTAALYNLFAGMVGGIEIDVQS
ncbi:MAG TPA: hypothetical protein VG871_07430 [Vicinamibacterales bacterium]|nr:hypothetical protein [Vicinamibacterales bacterium]